MTLYQKLKSLPIDDLLRMGLDADTAAQLKTGQMRWQDLTKSRDFCPVNISRDLLGNDDLYCEGISKKCAACSTNFLTAEWTHENEQQYMMHKVGLGG